MIPEASKAELQRARDLVERDALAEALTLALELEARHPRWVQPLLLRADIVARPGREGEVAPVLERLLVDFPGRPGALIRAERLVARHRPLATALAGRLAPGHGRHPIVARLLCEQAVAEGRLDEARDLALAGLTAVSISPSHVVLGQQLLMLGARAEVAAWIAAVTAGEPDFVSDPARERFEAFARRQAELGDASGCVRIYRTEGARDVLFVFGGLRNQPGVEESELVAWLRGLPIHVVALRDPSLLMYLKGAPGLAEDFDGMCAALRRIADELGGGRVLMFGPSAGGYAALRYGDAIDADGVLCDSALTDMTEASMRADGRAGAVAARMLAEVPDQLVDMREVLRRRTRPLRIELWYGADMPLDRAYAERLADVPGVTLRPVPGHAAHGLINKHPQARDWLRAFVEDARAARAP